MKYYNASISQEEPSHLSAEKNDDASSEMIGSIILIGVFVAAFGIILVMLLSAPSEFIVPAVVIEADVIVEDDQYVLHLRSGDTLERNETRILVDGIDRTGDFTAVTGTSDWDKWGSGDSLSLDLAGSDAPDDVEIIYYSPEGDGMLLWDVGTSVTVIPPTSLTPKVAFSANVTSGFSPLSVRFMDLSSNEPNAWQWNFGDGGSSSQQNPVHTYTAPGVYTVQLTAHNPDGPGTLIKSGYIQVSEGFVVNFTATPLSGTAPLMVSFTDLTTGTPVSWLWDFGDNNTSTEQNPVHTYLSGGSYTVTLQASDGILSQTEEKYEYINVTEVCLPGLYGTYYNGHNRVYSVPFPGNSVNRIDPRIWFADDASGEESDEADWPVATLGKTNKFSVVYEGYLIVPKNETYTFYLRSDDGSVLWIDNVADTDPVVIDNWGNGYHSPKTKSASLSLSKGKHPIRIKMTENEGKAVLHLEWESATIPRQVVESFCYVPGGLAADFSAAPRSGFGPLTVQFTDLSLGNITSWAWDFGDGETSPLQHPEHSYTTPGRYNVSLTVTDSVTSATEVKEEYITVTGLPLPVAWWRFDEASGNTAIDSSGNDNDGTIAGGSADRRAGACGTGLYFDGSSTWVSVPDDDTLGFSDTFTFAGWFRPEVPINYPNQLYPYNTQIIGKGYDKYQNWKGPHLNNYEIFLQVNSDRLWFEANGDGDSASTEAFLSEANGLPVSYDEWFHLAVVVDGEEGRVYINGNPESTFSVDRTPLQENNEPVSIGRQIVTGVHWPADFYYKGMMDELILYGTALTPDQVSSLADACAPPSGGVPEVSFSADPVTGDAPLDVQFTSSVSGSAPFTYLWTFGDGTTSTEAHPLHRYESPGTYSVSLTVSNAVGLDTYERTDYIEVTDNPFAGYIVNENVFVYGDKLEFSGNRVSGPGATIHITGDALNTNDLNGGTSLAVSNIYVDGFIDLNGGSAGLGSEISPGSIYVNGDLTLRNGQRAVYGDVYVNGDCFLKDPVIHGDVYVNGDLELDWTPDLTHARIYYTGNFVHPESMKNKILNRCNKVAAVPGFVIPDYGMPPVKGDAWYSSRGYVSGGALADDMKIFADNYVSSSWLPPAENVIIVAEDGDITLTGLGGSGVTGVLFAPNGKVVFSGASFEGVVIAKDGFFVTSGGTEVTFKNMDEYISDPADYPF
ncbi:hypothetical protein JCM10550A_24820 [Methanogenium cariaci]